MPQTINPIPEDHHTITPYIIVKGAAKALQFYCDAFGAEELYRSTVPDGRVIHSKIKIGDSIMMVGDEFPQEGCEVYAPTTLKGTVCMLHLYVKDVDATYQRAVKAGAKAVRPVKDMFGAIATAT